MTEPRTAAEVTPERLALWHDYPWTEAGESLLVNAEWHGSNCTSNRTRKYADCDCSLVGAVVSVEVEAVIAHRLANRVAAPDSPLDAARLAKAEAQRDQAWSNLDLVHEDIAAMLRASGLGDYARPISTHDVVQTELLPWIVAHAALRGEADK